MSVVSKETLSTHVLLNSFLELLLDRSQLGVNLAHRLLELLELAFRLGNLVLNLFDSLLVD
jgi:hypothetical protein